jgi:hypothetical protein
MERLLDLGVDALMSDFPDRAAVLPEPRRSADRVAARHARGRARRGASEDPMV